jgi:hypothetical protein
MSPFTTIYCQISTHNLAFCTHLCNLEDIDSKFSLRSQKEQWQKHLKFTILLGFGWQISPLAQTNNKKSHWVRRPYCWSLLASPMMRKIAVKASRNRHCEMWKSILHEVQLCTTNQLSNRLHKTVKLIRAQHIFHYLVHPLKSPCMTTWIFPVILLVLLHT